MERVFILISTAAIFMILITAGGVYWLLTAEITKSREMAVASLAEGVATGINGQITVLNRTLDNMTEDPEVIAAAVSGDAGRLRQIEQRLMDYLPGIMKLGIFLKSSNILDQSAVPHMGYADLDLVRESFEQRQAAMVQGDKGPNRHLAIARQIRSNNQIIGVLLVSLDYDFLKTGLTTVNASRGFMELKQGKLVMVSNGDKKLKEHEPSGDVKIFNTGWLIQYWSPEGSGFGEKSLLFSIILIPCLLAGLVFFIGYRNITAMLVSDQGSVLKVVKDLMTGTVQGNYPVSLNEMRNIISTVIQFKRVLDHESEEDLKEEDDGLALDDFFSETSESTSEQSDPAVKQAPADFSPLGMGVPVLLPENNDVSEPGPTVFEINEHNPKDRDSTAEIFRAYDIRGIAGKSLTNEVVYDIGRALGSEAKDNACQCVVIARDGRLSSPALSEAMAQGLIASGRDVIDLGIAPTPLLYFVTHHHTGHSGVMITGSHNPADYNGLKMVINGETLAGERIQGLKQRIDKGDLADGGSGNLETNNLFVNEYIGVISDDIHLARPMKVVVDSGNGVAGELGPTLLKTLGCEVIELFCEIDGNFPNHHPDPSQPENLKDLITAVKHYAADIGIAFDGDGDRLGLIDSQGKIIWPDRQLMLFAKDVLANQPGAEIIYDVKCTKHLAEYITKQGGRALMWKTGHSFMKAKIKETGAKLAGEMSGHFFFNDRWFGFDDGLYAAARMIEILSADSRTSSEVFADFPDSINTPELNVKLKEGENFLFISQLIKSADFGDATITDIDGLRVDYSDGWGLIRASNTIPVLVLRFEADNNAAMQRIQEQFTRIMREIKPDIELPF